MEYSRLGVNTPADWFTSKSKDVWMASHTTNHPTTLRVLPRRNPLLHSVRSAVLLFIGIWDLINEYLYLLDYSVGDKFSNSSLGQVLLSLTLALSVFGFVANFTSLTNHLACENWEG